MNTISNESMFALIKQLWTRSKDSNRVFERKALTKLNEQYSNLDWVKENIKPIADIDLEIYMTFITTNGRVVENWNAVAKKGLDEITTQVKKDVPELKTKIDKAWQKLRFVQMLSGSDVSAHLPLVVKEVKDIRQAYSQGKLVTTIGGFDSSVVKGRVPFDKLCKTPERTTCKSLTADQVCSLAKQLITCVEEYRRFNTEYAKTGIGRYIQALNIMRQDKQFNAYATVLSLDIKQSPLTLRLLEKQIEAFTKIITLSVND